MQYNRSDFNLRKIVNRVDKVLRLKNLSTNTIYLYGIRQDKDTDVVIKSDNQSLANFLKTKSIRIEFNQDNYSYKRIGLGYDLRNDLDKAVKLVVFLVYVMNEKVIFNGTFC